MFNFAQPRMPIVIRTGAHYTEYDSPYYMYILDIKASSIHHELIS